jgi:hypothetical protein
MTTTKKLVVAVVALSLALVSVVGATLAFLIAESEEVVNTFTYGKIAINLWENRVDEDGYISSGTVTSQTYVNVVPGDTLQKNPTVTIQGGSEDCYLYVLVTNNLVLEGTNRVAPVATYHLIENSWEKVGEKGNAILYRCVKGGEVRQKPGDYTVFDTVTFNENLTVDDVAELAELDDRIVIQAYAHQADNVPIFDADDAAIEWANVDAVNP